jgi:hypothetical protein
MAFEELKQRTRRCGAPLRFERVAETLAELHRAVVDARGGPGDRWLDVGSDRRARVHGGRDRRRGDWLGSRACADRDRPQPGGRARPRRYVRGGRCRSVAPRDASFDVATSSVGAIFGPDREAVAGELGRVCRSGGGWVSQHGRPAASRRVLPDHRFVRPATATRSGSRGLALGCVRKGSRMWRSLRRLFEEEQLEHQSNSRARQGPPRGQTRTRGWRALSSTSGMEALHSWLRSYHRQMKTVGGHDQPGWPQLRVRVSDFGGGSMCPRTCQVVGRRAAAR